MFGEIAELYDRYRPAYPDRLVDDLVELAGLEVGQPVLEVGAGTGKATAMFAARKLSVVAVEPSTEMAAVARRSCSAYPGVVVEESDFEDWDRARREFQLLFSAQAWHWVAPEVRYERARAALCRNGLLAVFWNRPVWRRSDLREALAVVYEEVAPKLAADAPMHPANLCPDAEEDWEGELAAVDGFTDAEVRYYDWGRAYSAETYCGLLRSTSEIQLLEEKRRGALIEAVIAVIEAHGGYMALPLATRLCLARRAD
ncbi:MAG: class I SAM-dependent methyltransferase [Actinomycetota bacterium]|nr:class I SAM-dependent methyltransferase [Actinomycetota bacterium]